MKSYQHGLQSFLKFRVEFGLLDNWPVSENELMNFVSYLYKRGFSWSTVNSYLSALSFHNKINKYVGNAQLFVIRKMVDGLKRINAKKRLSLTIK
jgi:site-specific recombinase XerC